MTEELNPHYRLVLSTHPDSLQASALLFFAALAYPGWDPNKPDESQNEERHRTLYHRALLAYFARAVVKNARAAGAKLSEASALVPRELWTVRPDFIPRQFNMAEVQLDRRLAAAYVLRGLLTPDGWDLRPRRTQLPVRTVHAEISRQFAVLDTIVRVRKGSKPIDGEELDPGALRGKRRDVWSESLPVLHLAAQLDEVLFERAEALAPWQNKIIGLINTPDWLPDAAQRAKHMAEKLLPMVLKPSEVGRLLPLFLTPEPF